MRSNLNWFGCSANIIVSNFYVDKMPVIILTGIPASGKTKTANELKEFFEGKSKKINLISENEVIKGMQMKKDDVYSDSKIEKEVRSIIRSNFTRTISQDEIMIIDALNYIKGYRYELYCASKGSKTTQCTIHCDANPGVAWDYNISRDSAEQYGKEVFDGLILRYEAPDSRNRWDAPLFSVCNNLTIPFQEIYEALFNRKPPPPNQSTQCPPLSETNFLYETDSLTQEIISSIISSKKLNLEGEISVPRCDEKFLLTSDKNTSLAELTRMKRQFLSYVKLHPKLYGHKGIAGLFVQYLNTNL